MLAIGGLSMITTAGRLSIPAAIGAFGIICELVSIFGPNRWVELFTQGI
ncbi:hypothetical protein [Prosthecobacter sp.]|nr:hypothetical protein [Prosthecobacter sp.]MDI1315654.1 hypothetical protein [Prosthecobacter sp.]